MNKPNLFVIGAPKCGTTTICYWLNQHPNVFFSPIKEPHFFYSPYGKIMTHDEYLSLFEDATSSHNVIGEGSVWYLFSRLAASKIISYQPKAKFIVCIRNPLEMAISLHAQKLFTGHEKIERFDEAWSVRNERLKGNKIGIFGGQAIDASHMAYNSACLLGDQIKDLLSYIPKNKVHIIVMDDLKRDPLRTWRSLCMFLNIEPFENVDFAPKNPATKRRSPLLQRLLIRISRAKKILGFQQRTGLLGPLTRLNSQKIMYRQPGKKVLREMRKEFSTDIEVLSRMLNRDFRHWID